MKLTLHRMILYLTIKLFPKLFERYYAEYEYTAEKYKKNMCYNCEGLDNEALKSAGAWCVVCGRGKRRE